jgi:hypothetical protein
MRYPGDYFGGLYKEGLFFVEGWWSDGKKKNGRLMGGLGELL